MYILLGYMDPQGLAPGLWKPSSFFSGFLRVAFKAPIRDPLRAPVAGFIGFLFGGLGFLSGSRV